MSLIVAGATGAIGRCVVLEALQRSEITQVVALTRSLSVSDPAALFGFTVGPTTAAEDPSCETVTEEQLSRLRPVTFDWELFCRFWQERQKRATDNVTKATGYIGGSYEATEAYYSDLFSGHKYAAMCLGTTRRDAGSAAAFVRCDYDYVVAFAEALKTFGGTSLATYAQVSAQLASKNSWFLYPKTKGRADAAVEMLQFPRLRIYRLGLLDRGKKTRINEKIAKWFVKGLPVRTCGRAIVRDFIYPTALGNTSLHVTSDMIKRMTAPDFGLC